MKNENTKAALKLKGSTIKNVSIVGDEVALLTEDGFIFNFSINSGNTKDESPRNPFLEVKRHKEVLYQLPKINFRQISK